MNGVVTLRSGSNNEREGTNTYTCLVWQILLIFCSAATGRQTKYQTCTTRNTETQRLTDPLYTKQTTTHTHIMITSSLSYGSSMSLTDIGARPFCVQMMGKSLVKDPVN